MTQEHEEVQLPTRVEDFVATTPREEFLLMMLRLEKKSCEDSIAIIAGLISEKEVKDGEIAHLHAMHEELQGQYNDRLVKLEHLGEKVKCLHKDTAACRQLFDAMESICRSVMAMDVGSESHELSSLQRDAEKFLQDLKKTEESL